MHDPGLFEVMGSTRAMKRLRPDPVPLSLVRRVINAGTTAPSGLDTQPWEFIVVRDEARKRFIQERYLRFTRERFGAVTAAVVTDDSRKARVLRGVFHLAEHLHEAPVLLLVCGHRDWPMAVPEARRVGLAPPPYGSIFPCVQNVLLACRAVGLGASLTTIHQMFEAELRTELDVPDDVAIVALIPIGFPHGKFGPVTRIPGEDLTHFDHWGNRGAPDDVLAETNGAQENRERATGVEPATSSLGS